MIVAQEKRWYWVWEADRFTGKRVTAPIKRCGVSVDQVRNFYRHELYEGVPYCALDNLIVAEEVGVETQADEKRPSPKPVRPRPVPPEQPEFDFLADPCRAALPCLHHDPPPKKR
jgi:hypothetical protein